MLYEVISDFKDGDGKVYLAGDSYEKELTEEREEVLVTNGNKYGRPFLKKVEEGKLEDKTIPELKGLADERELEYDPKIKKEDLLKLISK